MQIVCFSYICTTLCTGTYGLILGVDAWLRIAEMEKPIIYHLFSKDFIIILFIIIIQYISVYIFI